MYPVIGLRRRRRGVVSRLRRTDGRTTTTTHRRVGSRTRTEEESARTRPKEAVAADWYEARALVCVCVWWHNAWSVRNRRRPTV